MKYRILAAIAVTALAGSSSQGFAQSTNTDAILQRLEAKVDALAKENAELRERVRNLEPSRQAAKTPSHEKVRTLSAPLPPQIGTPPVLAKSAAPIPLEVKRPGGLVGGVEGMAIKPYYSGDGAPNVDAAASNPFTGFVNYRQMPYDYKGGFRTWLGYVDGNGLGARVRFFDYRQGATNDVSGVFTAPAGVFIQSGSLKLQTYDLEVTKQANFGDWNLQGFAGVRYVKVDQQSIVNSLGIMVDGSDLTYKGVGLTGGVEGEAALWTGSPWSIFFSGRGSFLYGKQTDNTTDLTFLYTPGFRSQNSFASIWEFNAGPQWTTPVAGVGDVYVRLTADAQYWQGVGNFSPIGTSPSPGLNHNDFGGGFGLLGFTAAVGVKR